MSIEYGVTSTGFNVKRLADIKAEIEADLRAVFGDINTAPDSVFGQLIGSFAKPAADVWEKMEQVYLSQYPSSAEGIALDNVASINAIERLGPTSTLAQAAVEGIQGTLVPTGTQFSTEDDNDLFETVEDVVIDEADVVKSIVTIDPDGGAAGDFTGLIYTIQINAASPGFQYTALAGDTEVEIAEALKTLVNAGSIAVTAAVPTTPDGTVTLTGDLGEDGNPTPYAIVVSRSGTPPGAPDPTIDVTERWTPVDVQSVEKGPILCVTGTLTQIETPVAGLNSVDNYVDGTIGRTSETDEELRLRRRGSLQVVGAGTVGAIRARLLQEVEGVSEVAIFENREDTTVDSRPGHSFECVVQGGIDQDIGEKIWEVKPAGIQTTYGASTGPSAISVNVVDSNGDTQVVRFSRPTSKYAWVRVVVTAYADAEEQFPIDGLSQIAANILALGESLTIGRDLTVQRWYGPIYQVPGISSVTVEHALEDLDTDPPVYTTSNITVESTWLPLFDAARIDVTLAP